MWCGCGRVGGNGAGPVPRVLALTPHVSVSKGDEVVAMVMTLVEAPDVECEGIAESISTIIDKYQEGSHLLDAYLGAFTLSLPPICTAHWFVWQVFSPVYTASHRAPPSRTLDHLLAHSFRMKC
jgi:hypothetical protein